jgi:hypothetical protein
MDEEREEARGNKKRFRDYAASAAFGAAVTVK